MLITIIGRSIKQGDIPPRYASRGPSEAVVDAQLQSSDVEVVEITVQWSVTISSL